MEVMQSSHPLEALSLRSSLGVEAVFLFHVAASTVFCAFGYVVVVVAAATAAAATTTVAANNSTTTDRL